MCMTTWPLIYQCSSDSSFLFQRSSPVSPFLSMSAVYIHQFRTTNPHQLSQSGRFACDKPVRDCTATRTQEGAMLVSTVIIIELWARACLQLILLTSVKRQHNNPSSELVSDF